MTTILIDDSTFNSGPLKSAYTIKDHLDRGFDSEKEFFILNGRPYAGDCYLELIYDYGCNPPREAHSFMPCIKGTKVSEAEFRTLVCTLHHID